MFETLGKTYTCRAGDAFVIFPGVLFKYEASKEDPWHYMWVAFLGDHTLESLESIGMTPDRPVLRNGSLQALNRLFNGLKNSLERAEHSLLGNMEASGWLRLILHKLASEDPLPKVDEVPASSRSNRQVDQAIRLLTLQYGQNLSIGSIAQTLGYHRAHLTRMFKEVTGLSPMQYLFKIRMKKAEELLETDLTIAQVAASVGYNDPLYFSKQFHKWSG